MELAGKLWALARIVECPWAYHPKLRRSAAIIAPAISDAFH